MAGAIFYDSEDFETTLKSFNEKYKALAAKGLPQQLTMPQGVFNTPFGRLFGAFFTWSSEDEETGREWLQKIEAFGAVKMNTVSVITVPEWHKAMVAVVPTGIYGHSKTLSLREMTSEVTDIVAKSMEKMPSDPVRSSGSSIPCRTSCSLALFVPVSCDVQPDALIQLHIGHPLQCTRVPWYSFETPRTFSLRN